MELSALGELLVAAGGLTQEAWAAMHDALPVDGAAVVRARLLPLLQNHERAVCDVIAARSGAPVLVLDESTIDLGGLDLLAPDVAVDGLVLPVFVEGDALTVAVDVESDDLKQRLAAATGRNVLLVVAVPPLLEATATLARMLRAQGESTLAGGRSTSATPCLALARPPAVAVTAAAPPVAEDVARALGELLSAALEEPARSADTVTSTAPTTSSPATSKTPAKPVSRLGAVKLKQVSRGPAPKPESPSATTLLHAPLSAASPRDLIELPPLSLGDGPRALVVEDDDAIRTLLVRVLGNDGFVVEHAGDGRTALALMRRRRPDLVVLDAMLPEIHGFEICAALKKSEAWSSIPVLMISAVFRGFDNARAIQEIHGADVFVEKPFDLRHLRRVVAQLLQRPQPVEPRAETAEQDVERARGDVARCQSEGNLEGILMAVRQWIAADPFDADAWLLLGRVHAQRADSLSALQAFERAATYGDAHFEAQVALATAYESFGFQRRSRAVWSRAAVCAPDPEAAAKIRTALEAWR